MLLGITMALRESLLTTTSFCHLSVKGMIRRKSKEPQMVLDTGLSHELFKEFKHHLMSLRAGYLREVVECRTMLTKNSFQKWYKDIAKPPGSAMWGWCSSTAPGNTRGQLPAGDRARPARSWPPRALRSAAWCESTGTDDHLCVCGSILLLTPI